MIQMLFFQNSYSWEITFGLAFAGFGLGFLFKSGLIFKQRKRILRLEDEMLSNHSRILTLEKKIAENRRDFDFTPQRSSEREVKVS